VSPEIAICPESEEEEDKPHRGEPLDYRNLRYLIIHA
jgi:hypothetical protein